MITLLLRSKFLLTKARTAAIQTLMTMMLIIIFADSLYSIDATIKLFFSNCDTSFIIYLYTAIIMYMLFWLNQEKCAPLKFKYHTRCSV